MLDRRFFTSLTLRLIFLKLHNRNIYLFENHTVSVLLKIFGCIDNHINFFGRTFINVMTKNNISNHFEVFLSCDKSSFSDDLMETLAGLNVNSKGVKNQY